MFEWAFIIKAVVTALILFFVVPVVWEWAALSAKWTYSFHWLMNLILPRVHAFWDFLGGLFARISSFLEVLHIENLMTAVSTVVYFYWSLLTSWAHAIKGYMTVANARKYPGITIATSIVLLAIVVYFAEAYFFDGVLRRMLAFIAFPSERTFKNIRPTKIVNQK